MLALDCFVNEIVGFPLHINYSFSESSISFNSAFQVFALFHMLDGGELAVN